MYKVAVIGDRDSIFGFGVLGIECFFCENKESALEAFDKVSNEDFAVVYITEDLFEYLLDTSEFLLDKSLLSIVPIPGLKGSSGIGMKRVSGFVEKAVGSDIVSQEN